MEDEDIAPNTYLQLIQLVWAEIVTVHTIFHHGVLTDWISCMDLAPYPRLPFCVLIYQFIYAL